MEIRKSRHVQQRASLDEECTLMADARRDISKRMEGEVVLAVVTVVCVCLSNMGEKTLEEMLPKQGSWRAPISPSSCFAASWLA